MNVHSTLINISCIILFVSSIFISFLYQIQILLKINAINILMSIFLINDLDSFNTGQCISILDTINDFLNIRLRLVPHVATELPRSIPGSQVHNFLISCAFMNSGR